MFIQTAHRFLLALVLAGTTLPVLEAASPATNSSASLVLGQSVFTTNTTASPATAGSLNLPGGVAVDATSGKVFVADTANNRVLRYPKSSSLTNGAAPDLVFGQINFSSSAANQGSTTSQTSLSAPNAVFVDASGNLWIADTGNNRVLMFANAANISSMPSFADLVLGQANFTANAAAPTQSTMAAPAGLCVDPNGVLWVADTGSHRVLGFKTAATLGNGANANRVLGQTSFTANAAGTTQTTFFKPTGVAANASLIWVADSANNRALQFQNYPTINGAPASLVLGQTTYVSSTPATSATGLTLPTSVALSGSTVWVADSSNNRILNYAISGSTVPGAAATKVIGQAVFTTGTAGLSAQKVSLYQSNQIFVDSASSLWVADQLNNRILRFGSSSATPTPTPTPTPPTVTVNGKHNFKTTKSSIKLYGTAASTVGIARVSYALNSGKYVKAHGTTSWQSGKIKLPLGKNYIYVASVDTNGLASTPTVIIVRRKSSN